MSEILISAEEIAELRAAVAKQQDPNGEPVFLRGGPLHDMQVRLVSVRHLTMPDARVGWVAQTPRGIVQVLYRCGTGEPELEPVGWDPDKPGVGAAFP